MKRILALMLSVVMLLSCVAVSSFAEETTVEYKRGDLNGDGKFNIMDVAYLLKYCARWDFGEEMNERCRMTGDVNEDGKINLHDATFYLKFLANNGIKPTPNPHA